MAACRVPGAHASELEWNHFIAEQRDDPANGTNETRTAFAGPVHRLRERDLRDDAGQCLGEHVSGLAPRHMLLESEVFAFGSLRLAELLDRDAHLLRKTLRGTRAAG